VYALCSAGARVHIANRTRSAADRLAQELREQRGFHATSGSLADLIDLGPFEVLVNASSAGMTGYGDESPVPEGALHRDLVVMDIVYKPVRTALLAAAERSGARTIHGGRMLLHQACRQFELYTGHDAPEAAMDAALRRALADVAE
jgi:shikimate dehydrogenase